MVGCPPAIGAATARCSLGARRRLQARAAEGGAVSSQASQQGLPGGHPCPMLVVRQRLKWSAAFASTNRGGPLALTVAGLSLPSADDGFWPGGNDHQSWVRITQQHAVLFIGRLPPRRTAATSTGPHGHHGLERGSVPRPARLGPIRGKLQAGANPSAEILARRIAQAGQRLMMPALAGSAPCELQHVRRTPPLHDWPCPTT